MSPEIRSAPEALVVPAMEARLFVSVFTGVDDVVPQYREGTLQDILSAHETIIAAARLNHTPRYSCARFRPGGARCVADVVELSAVVLDFDRLFEHRAALLFEALKQLGVAYGAHTTRQHDPEMFHRYRIILPLSRPATPREFDATVRELLERLGAAGIVDGAVHDISHPWAFPERNPGEYAQGAEAIFHRDGKLLEPVVPPPAPPVSAQVRVQVPESYTVESLRGLLQQRRSRQEDVSRATDNICQGLAWDDDQSGRDRMLWRVLASVTRLAPGVTQEVLEEWLAPSVAAVRSLGSHLHMGLVRKKIHRAVQQALETPCLRSEGPRRLGARVRRGRVAAFVLERLEAIGRAELSGHDLYAGYRAWAEERGGAASTKDFAHALKEQGIVRKWVRGRSRYAFRFKPPTPAERVGVIGVGLNPPPGPPSR